METTRCNALLNLMEKQINYIMDTFNFEQVYVAMSALDRKWRDGFDPISNEIPTIKRLKTEAKRLLQLVVKSGGNTSSGGFEAEYYPPEEDCGLYTNAGAGLALRFILTESDSREYDND